MLYTTVLGARRQFLANSVWSRYGKVAAAAVELTMMRPSVCPSTQLHIPTSLSRTLTCTSPFLSPSGQLIQFLSAQSTKRGRLRVSFLLISTVPPRLGWLRVVKVMASNPEKTNEKMNVAAAACQRRTNGLRPGQTRPGQAGRFYGRSTRLLFRLKPYYITIISFRRLASTDNKPTHTNIPYRRVHHKRTSSSKPT